MNDRDSVTAPGPANALPGLSNLAENALARLCAETRPGDTSGAALSILGDPCAAAMAYALCDEDDAAASLLVDDLLEAGVPVEDVCLDHLAPAARRLGELWDRDRLPFTEVAMASARIQAILRRLPAGRCASGCAHGRGAVFAAVPGEQHTLGVMMAAELFRRCGWDVSLLVGLGHDDLLGRLAKDDRPVIGLSCSGDHSYPALRRLIAALARVRADAHVLLSGRIIETPERVSDLRMSVVPVPDMPAAEAEMRRIEALLASSGVARLAEGRRRANSAA